MEKCLFDAKAILDGLNIPFYLCTGTALGFVREGGFIAHDYDVDIAVDVDNFKPDIIQAFCKSGKFTEWAFRTIDTIYVELSFKHVTSGIRIDIFVTFHDGNDHLFNVLWDFCGKGPGNPILLYHTCYSMGIVNYKGVDFYCPGEDYLVQMYGENWRTPLDFKTIGDSPYLASLKPCYRPCLLNVEKSKEILDRNVGMSPCQ
jgi:hypothetical protein